MCDKYPVKILLYTENKCINITENVPWPLEPNNTCMNLMNFMDLFRTKLGGKSLGRTN